MKAVHISTCVVNLVEDAFSYLSVDLQLLHLWLLFLSPVPLLLRILLVLLVLNLSGEQVEREHNDSNYHRDLHVVVLPDPE